MQSLLKNKKGQLANLQGVIMSLVFIGIFLGVGFLVLSEFMDQMDTGSDAEDGVNDTIQAMKVIPSWLSIIVIIAIVGLLIAILFAVMPRTAGGI